MKNQKIHPVSVSMLNGAETIIPIPNNISIDKKSNQMPFKLNQRNIILNACDDNDGWYNIKDEEFGAIGDGVADDTAAIQKAIQYAQNFTICPGVVFLPPGIYKITQRLEIVKNMSFIGAGRESTIIKAENCSGILAKSEKAGMGASAGGMNGITLRGFTLTTNTTGKVGIKLWNAFHIVQEIRLCGEENRNMYWKNAIYTADIWYSMLNDIHIQGGRLFNQRNGIGIFMDYSMNNVIYNCHFLALDTGIKNSRTLHPTFRYACEGNRITANNFMGCNDGIVLYKTLAITITDNIIDQMLKTGILISGHFDDGKNGVTVRGASVIKGNYIGPDKDQYPVNWNSINIEEGQRIRIIGNSLAGLGYGIGITMNNNSFRNIIEANEIIGFVIGVMIVGDKNIINSNTFQPKTGFTKSVFIFLGDRNIVTSNFFGDNGKLIDFGGTNTESAHNIGSTNPVV